MTNCAAKGATQRRRQRSRDHSEKRQGVLLTPPKLRVFSVIRCLPDFILRIDHVIENKLVLWTIDIGVHFDIGCRHDNPVRPPGTTHFQSPCAPCERVNPFSDAARKAFGTTTWLLSAARPSTISFPKLAVAVISGATNSEMLSEIVSGMHL